MAAERSQPPRGVSGGSAAGWSDRFEQGLNPAIERFNASIGFDLELLPQDLDGSIAHARMLGRCGVITTAEAGQLIEGLELVRAEAAAGHFNPGLEAEDVHFAVERRLIELLGPLGKKLHTGRSRNDQVGTDLRLWLRQKIDGLDGSLQRFQLALLGQAEAHADTLIPGYTHLQRAQPLCLAHHLLAYVEMAERDRQRLADVRRRVNICPLGAAALAGTPVPIDRRSTAAELGFEAIYANSLDAVSDRDFAVEFSAAASLILAHLSRLAEEVILWASEEFGFVQLTDRCATGSSLMPQKKNPDVPELVRGKTGRVFGHLQGLLTMIKGLPLAYNKDFQEDKEALFDVVRTTHDCLEAMAILIEEGISFQPERLEQAVAADFSNATDVADYLVARGVPFREAYHLVGGLVKTCLLEGLLLRDLPLDRWQGLHPAFEADVYAAIEPRQVVAARRSEGGTGFSQVRDQLRLTRLRLGAGPQPLAPG
ncbi:argininosuccinate lyase [Synechococcus sp. CS-1325]|uniref:argininosuccinate lyase n=1 Tax=unclassified Synechococcus TaxID=2626047 RepID=UPI000DB48A57|nr:MULTISPECIES: argininosuccinate lyase [unclassified Synechococcus]PZV02365.1 MAG: argininosuccinate lyase [Cyanobium sp.]MCT0199169.1 argininosuccinate lyase [Synechococcus sp. CS-1325]MCT0214652.1 argininosuccinate lyase [Synechococcus sp. CS-1326]MCT0231158.1 argininosuccinate lyase [Synechococcus sp. CS-1324]MCT0233986.1 argininosuccinate lyase [Synechococcus sp. CS-1327]